MGPRSWWAATLAVLILLAGCVDEDESRDDDGNERHFTVNVPAGATQVHVDVTGRATGGEPDVTVLVEDEAGVNLATDTWSVSNETRRVSVNVNGQARVVVTVRVVDGDAELDVRVSATVPEQTEPVVIVEHHVIIVQAQPAPAAPPVNDTPPASPPPAEPTPPSSPTPPASSPTPPAPTPPPPTPPANNTTNTTNGTNATG